jgi:DNA-binding transcriptional MerR regulator/methylmalonyl-CoA mutase cobalamin-binding subunit
MSSSFSIKAAAQRTGLTPHVIRAWERRYGAIDPERSAGKHRLYSEEDVERLALLRRAVCSGHSIGKIARLPTDDLRALTNGNEMPQGVTSFTIPDDTAAAVRTEIFEAVMRFDNLTLEEELRKALLVLGHQGLVQLVIAVLAREIGERWRAGELTVAHEHFFTASVKVFLGELTRQFATPLTAPRIVVSTPTGQLHELGAVMAAATAANLGWRSIYLGPSLPPHEIAGAALRNQAAAVALSIVYPEDDPHVARELSELARLLPENTRILVGGRAAQSCFETLSRIGALYAETLDQFGIQLDALRAPTPL